MTRISKNTDLLRTLAAFAVVCLHVSAKYVIGYDKVSDTSWWIANYVDSFSRWCVPVFVMLTGSLILTKEVPSLENFYRQKYYRIVPVILFWSVLYIIYYIYSNETASLFLIVKRIAKGNPYYHLWYLYMLVGFYLIAPFLASVVNTTTRNELFILCVICLSIAALDQLANQHNTVFITSFLPYIGYFLTGAYIAKYPPAIKIWVILSVFITSSTATALITGYLLSVIGPQSWEIMYAYLNPLVIISSLSAFLLLFDTQLKYNFTSKILAKIAPTTFGIYLIHPIILEQLNIFYLYSEHRAIIYLPVATIFVFLLSFIIVAILIKCSNLRRVFS